MRDPITRRDFLNGMALAIGTGLTPMDLLRAQSAVSGNLSTLTGMRGSSDASYTVAHQLRDGHKYPIAKLPIAETSTSSSTY